MFCTTKFRSEPGRAMSTTDIARSFIQRGWSPVPVRFKTKKPTCDAWQKLRITEADAEVPHRSKAEHRRRPWAGI